MHLQLVTVMCQLERSLLLQAESHPFEIVDRARLSTLFDLCLQRNLRCRVLPYLERLVIFANVIAHIDSSGHRNH